MLQYNLRTLLLAMFAFAIATWVVFVLPGLLGLFILTLISLIVPGLIVAGIVYCRGTVRAFCVGAAPGSGLMTFVWIWTVPSVTFPYIEPSNLSDSDIDTLKLNLVAMMVVAFVSGLGGMLIRYLAQPKAL